MTFVAEDDQKPKLPHKTGGSCRNCGARTASQWRGPGGDYCSIGKCVKAGIEARSARNTDKTSQRVDDLEEEVCELKDMVAAMQSQLARLAQERMMLPAPPKKKPRAADDSQVDEPPPKSPRAVVEFEALEEEELLGANWPQLLMGVTEVRTGRSEEELRARFEAAAGLAAGTIGSSKKLKAKWKRGMKRVGEEWDRREEARVKAADAADEASADVRREGDCE